MFLIISHKKSSLSSPPHLVKQIVRTISFYLVFNNPFQTHSHSFFKLAKLIFSLPNKLFSSKKKEKLLQSPPLILKDPRLNFPQKLAHARNGPNGWRPPLEKFRNPVNQRPVLLPVTTRLNILTPDSSVCERVYVNVPYVKVPPAEWPSSREPAGNPRENFQHFPTIRLQTFRSFRE